MDYATSESSPLLTAPKLNFLIALSSSSGKRLSKIDKSRGIPKNYGHHLPSQTLTYRCLKTPTTKHFVGD